MEYRKLGRTGLEVGAIGLGTEHLSSQPTATIEAVLRVAVEAGVNYVDLLWNKPDWWGTFRPAFERYRDRFVRAIHWGGNLHQVEECQRDFDAVLSGLCGGYADVALLTMVDTDAQWKGCARQGLERLQGYREQGRIAAVGATSHRASVALSMVGSGLIDVLMVPVNLFNHGDAGNGALYRACVERGVGLVAMKPYAGGQVFVTARPIPPARCMAYVLSQPVATTVPGVKSVQEMEAALHYWEASDEERDYGAVLSHVEDYVVGSCVYCNHCLPCPQGIDVGQAIQLADIGQHYPWRDDLVADYADLAVKPSACVACGECVERCPFDVDVVARMQEAAAFFEAAAAQ